MNRRLGGWLAAALAAVALTGCGSDALPRAPQVGDPLPPLTFAALTAPDSLSFGELEGRPALVNLWATWCPPCREEIPFLQELHETFGPRGLRVVGVSSDHSGAVGQVESFLAAAGVTYENVLDPRSSAMDAFRVIGLPATYLVDADGRIAFARTGPVSEADTAFLATIERLVAGGESAP